MSRKGLTELVMILDRSGSMRGLEADTIGGFNSMIERQKKEDGEAYVSVVLFDDQMEVICDRVDIQKVEPMTDRQYYVRGCTALLDAIGRAIHHIGTIHRYAREEDVPEKTIFVITTDGMENASREYTYDKVRRMIERQKEQYQWEFLFLGANIDAVKEAGRFGINASRAVNYEHDGQGTRLNYDVLSGAVGCARRAESASAMNAYFDAEETLAPIREDYKKRHRR
ncbi:MAG: VWA domain-containing protein [Lachnospiraceae bacterium]|nr:VWA domain-containing protein [Lachnospiraceae bacterium]